VILLVERAAVTWTRRLALLAGGVLLALSCATVLDALLRYFLGRPLPGTFEATELLLAAVIFFGMPYANVTDGHVSVDLLTQHLSRRVQYALIALNAAVSAVLLAAITVEMARLAAEFYATSRTTITARISVFPFILPVAAAAGLAVLGFLVQAAGASARALRPGLPPLPGGAGPPA
jgi:TRAP-type C4-dicarboxylate transport system permease small subunit